MLYMGRWWQGVLHTSTNTPFLLQDTYPLWTRDNSSGLGRTSNGSPAPRRRLMEFHLLCRGNALVSNHGPPKMATDRLKGTMSAALQNAMVGNGGVIAWYYFHAFGQFTQWLTILHRHS